MNGLKDMLLFLAPIIMLVLVASGQPQYRTVVDPPVTVTDLPNGVSGVQSTLCFREMGSTSEDINYCPLGFLTFPNDEFDGPSMTLDLRDGAEGISAAYPSGVGLLVLIKGVGTDNHIQTLGTHISDHVGGEPETLVRIGPVRVEGGRVTFTATIGVSCNAGFTGPHCLLPGSTIGTTPPTFPPTTRETTTTAETTDRRATTMMPTSEPSATTEPATVTIRSPTTAEPTMATSRAPITANPESTTNNPTAANPTTAEPATTKGATTTTTAAEEKPTTEPAKSPTPITVAAAITTENTNTEKPSTEKGASTTVEATTSTENFITEGLENFVASGLGGILIGFMVIAGVVGLAVVAVLLLWCLQTKGKKIKRMWIMRKVEKQGTKMMLM